MQNQTAFFTHPRLTPMRTSVDAKAASRRTSASQVGIKDSLTTMKKKKREREVVCEYDDDECFVISPIVVLKKKSDMRRYEKSEECFILDFDPFEVSAIKPAKQINEDVSLISEKGQVACRDYPHSRHLCLQYPFEKTPHESYCKLCYCYVCDTAAPCKQWKSPSTVLGHCHASNGIVDWKYKRELAKRMANTKPI